MTGRDLIVYILQNGLEDKPVIGNGTILNFMSEYQFAEKMDVGVATVRAWIDMDYLSGVLIGNTYFIPVNHSEWCKLLTISQNVQRQGSEYND